MGVLKMMEIQDARFVRLGYSGNDTYAEVEVRAAGRETPLVAAFRRSAAGELTLANVSEKREEYELDWYENNLHDAYASVSESLFPDAASRADFAERVLAFGGVRERLEDAFYYGS